jgi:hypothetical protein
MAPRPLSGLIACVPEAEAIVAGRMRAAAAAAARLLPADGEVTAATLTGQQEADGAFAALAVFPPG